MKKKALLLLLLLMIACTGLCACSKADEKASSASEEEEEEEEAESKPKKKKKKDKDKNKDKEEKKEYDDEEAKDAYIAMLSDEVTFTVDADVEDYIEKGKDYTISEFVNATVSNEIEVGGWDDDLFHLTGAEYSFIDCGNDGETEFVLCLRYGDSGDFNFAYFFKYVDGKILLKSEQYWPYRAFLDVNQCGYCIYSGAGGAAIYLTTAFYYDENCERVYLYDEEEYMMMAEPRVPKSYTRYDYESDEYPDDEFDNDGCYVFFLRFKEYEWDENSTHEDDYNKYYKDQVYHFEDDNGNDLEPSKEMQKIYEKDGIKWVGADEFEKIRTDHEKDCGLTPEVKEAPLVEWTDAKDIGAFLDLVVLTGDDLEGYGSYDVEPVLIANDLEKPYYDESYKEPWEYRPIILSELSCEENGIIDEEAWFEETGHYPLGNEFNDGINTFRLSGENQNGHMTVISVYDENGVLVYMYDLSDFLYDDDDETGNEDIYTERSVHCALMMDNYLYLSIYHNTYAESCPENGYIICIDVDTDNIVWISDPLVVNSDNFVRYGDSIICGYGFTNEKDYLYVLNRFTGKTEKKIPLKKSPDYLTYVGDDLWVRTYSYDYVFTIADE